MLTKKLVATNKIVEGDHEFRISWLGFYSLLSLSCVCSSDCYFPGLSVHSNIPFFFSSLFLISSGGSVFFYYFSLSLYFVG